MKKLFVATALASCSFIPSLIFSSTTFTQGKSPEETCLIGLVCAAGAEPNVKFSETNDNEEVPSKILNLTDEKSLSLLKSSQNPLSDDPNSVPVFTPLPEIFDPCKGGCQEW